MSRWNDWNEFASAPKKPPPAHGIRVKKVGVTWWGKRWIEALERMSSSYSSRLARGRSYARAGRTHDLLVEAGQVTAKVTGSAPTPYEVTMQLKKLSDNAWTKAVEAMALKAQFSAELLAGRMPDDIDEAFRAGGVSIFPAKAADLTTHCDCPDSANPCKHVAATHYVLGEAIDRDPFLLFELRGRTKDRVLEALQAARSDGVSSASTQRPPRSKRAVKHASVDASKVTLPEISAADYDRSKEAPPSLHFLFSAPVTHGALIRQLGAPATWNGKRLPVDLLLPLVRAASEKARQLALAEPDAETLKQKADASRTRRGKRTTARA
ncbi:MAG: hypothetical protein NVS3B20_03950 [Polyangiales bacterium]